MENLQPVYLNHIEREAPLILEHLIPMARRLNWVHRDEKGKEYVSVYAYELFKKMLEEKLTFRDVNAMIAEIEYCHVCKKCLLPDDEAYSVENGKVACDSHSIMDEETDMYVTAL